MRVIYHKERFGCAKDPIDTVSAKLKSCLFFVLFCLDIGDGQLEVVGLENTLFVSQIIVGVRAHGLRLAQCSSIVIR